MQVEAADWRSVLAILGPSDQAATAERLVRAVRAAKAQWRAAGADGSGDGRAVCIAAKLDELQSAASALLSGPGCRAMSPRAAWFACRSHVALSAATSRIAAEAVSPYPPGVPLVWPGEIITSQVVDLVRALIAAGGGLHGIVASPAGEPGAADPLVAVVAGEES